MCPAVDAPHDGKDGKNGGVGCGCRYGQGIGEAEHEVSQCRHYQSGGHETGDVGVVGQETVDKFADGICPEKAKADGAELGGVEHAAFNDRAFDYIE